MKQLNFLSVQNQNYRIYTYCLLQTVLSIARLLYIQDYRIHVGVSLFQRGISWSNVRRLQCEETPPFKLQLPQLPMGAKLTLEAHSPRESLHAFQLPTAISHVSWGGCCLQPRRRWGKMSLTCREAQRLRRILTIPGHRLVRSILTWRKVRSARLLFWRAALQRTATGAPHAHSRFCLTRGKTARKEEVCWVLLVTAGPVFSYQLTESRYPYPATDSFPK